jgi:hypothetical protein
VAFSHPPKQLSCTDASVHLEPCMHHLQAVPLRHETQLVCLLQAEPPAGATQPAAFTVQSAALHELTTGPLLVPAKHELLLLHHPQPGLATQRPHVPAMVAQSTCEPGCSGGVVFPPGGVCGCVLLGVACGGVGAVWFG